MGLISQIPVYPAGYTVEDVLDDAFAPLHKMEREMTQLAEAMGRGEDEAAMARYDKLTAAFQAGGGYEMDTNKNKVCNGLSISAQMRQRPFDKLSGGEKTRVNLGRLILEDTDILLLDEPTNHLDLRATCLLYTSIAREQDSVSLSRGTEEKLSIVGRHDPCIVPRAVPVVEAAAALVLLDTLLDAPAILKENKQQTV